MPNRILRESILTSERVNALPLAAELFYRRLMSIVDDYGRTEHQLQILRAKCYPLQLDRVTVEDIEAWLGNCSSGDSPLITIYSVGSKRYIEVNNFGQRTRGASKYPAPQKDATTSSHALANGSAARTSANNRGQVSADVGASPQSAAYARATTPPTPSHTNFEVQPSNEEKPSTGAGEVSLAILCPPALAPPRILEELRQIYSQGGVPIPDAHHQIALQYLSDIPVEKRARVPNYVKWAFVTGKWPSPAKTKGLLNLLRDGDWDVELTQRTLPQSAAVAQTTAPQRAQAEAERQFRERKAARGAV
jgi:hypothetical protein